jgi:2-acylglycerol O-acyltransferase 2
VAEIFTSTPGRHTIVFKKRKGLCRLSIETGAEMIPCYVFGGTDFFHNLATDDGGFAKISRFVRAGVTIFWGRWGLPIPYAPRVRVCAVLMYMPSPTDLHM